MDSFRDTNQGLTNESEPEAHNVGGSLVYCCQRYAATCRECPDRLSYLQQRSCVFVGVS